MTRATTLDTPAAPHAPEALLSVIAERTGIGKEKLTINGDAAFDHVSVRAVGDGLEVHYQRGTSEKQISDAVDNHMRLAVRRPKDILDPYVVGPRGGKVRWTGDDEAEFRGRPPAESGYHWAMHDGELRYVREDVDAGPARPKRTYDEEAGTIIDDPGKGDNEFVSRSKADAFEELGGNAPREEFGAWVVAMERFTPVTRETMIEMMGNPRTDAGRAKKHRSVRHPLKDKLTPQLIAAITDPGHLRQRYPDLYAGVDASNTDALKKVNRGASHKAMLEATEHLGPADRGSIAEQWYVRMYASPDAVTHVKFTKAEMAQQGIILAKDRVPDIIDGTRLKDVKHVTGPLDADNKLQLEDFAKLVGPELLVDGRTMKLESMSVAFPDPLGVAANAQFIAGLVSSPNITVEIFNRRGDRIIVSVADRARSSLNPRGDVKGLVQAIKAFAAPIGGES
jgi:hypothetical protein